MIIYGWRNFTATNGSGQFYCPACDATRAYHQKSTRQWFTLYFFIPVFPLGGLTEYIECGGCRGSFQLGVLNYDPAAERVRAADDYRLTLIMLLHQCGRDERDLPQLSAIFVLFGVEASVEDLRVDLNHARQADPEAARTFHRRLVQATPEGKMLLLTAAAKVSGAARFRRDG